MTWDVTLTNARESRIIRISASNDLDARQRAIRSNVSQGCPVMWVSHCWQVSA